MNIEEIVEQERETIIGFRRHFHTYPELSQQEFETMAYIEDQLHAWGIDTVRIPRGGVFAFLDSGKPGKTLLMRADMDALPIFESDTNLVQNKVALSSRPGVMHACGHDGHMAMLLGEAKILATHKEVWQGKVVLMFEEAEEMGERGIGHMLRYLRDEKIPIDYCFGTHVRWDLPAGKMGILFGAVMAGAYFFRVKLHGKGGHGSRPDMAANPIEAFVSFASALRTYRMGHTDPKEMFTYSLATVQAGSEPNIIPNTLLLAGTARYMNNEEGLRFRETLLRLLEQSAESEGCTVEIVEDQYFPVTRNTEECVALARKAVETYMGKDVIDDNCEPWAATETFSITESVYPGVFVFTGISDEIVGSGAPHHTAAFDIGEEGLLTGTMTGLVYAYTILNEKPIISSFQPNNLEDMLELIR